MSTEPGLTLDYAPAGAPERRKAGAIATALLMAVVLVPLAAFVVDFGEPRGIFTHVWGGHLFRGRFDSAHAGMAMDQPTIGKWYLVFTVFSSAVLPYVAFVRWISSRRTPLAYGAFAAPAIVVCLLLITLLTGPFWWLVQYVRDMGLTARRLQGLAYGLGWYGLSPAFLWWALRRPKARPVNQVQRTRDDRPRTTGNQLLTTDK